MPRFSIILPLYNKEPYVLRTLESVARQTFRDIEAIVIDDGSTDSSAEVVERFLDGHPDSGMFRLVLQEDRGVSATRNRGVALATGEYVTFLDCDDWWEPGFLEEIDRLIRRYPEAGIYGTGYYLVKNGRRRVAPVGVDEAFVDGIIDYCDVYARTLCMPLTSDTVALRRDLFEASGGFRTDITLGEDFDFWLRIALKHPVAYLNRPLANYFQDLPSDSRAIGQKEYNPDTFMTFHFDRYAEEESVNPRLKVLLDKLRVYTLLYFRRKNLYPDRVQQEISKVDFSNVQPIYRFYYKAPYPLVRCYWGIMETLSSIKHRILR